MAPFLIYVGFMCTVYHSVHGHNDRTVKYQCPLDDPTPCDCTGPYGSVHLRCSGLSNRKQLEAAFEKMAGRGITELLIRDSNITHIPRDLFRDSPVSRVRIDRSTMIYLFDRELEYGGDALTQVLLEDVDFEGGLDWTVLDNLKSLRILGVSGSGIETLPPTSSELELPVETLILQKNYLEEMPEFALQNFGSLRRLKLNNNLLRRYERSMLPLPESGIRFLDLSYNKLTLLPADAFDGMRELHSLLLRGNKLKVLQKSYMGNIYSSLYFFDVANNPLRCDCEMTWLLSDSKPYHIFGECTTLKDNQKRNLQAVTNEDFEQCS